MKNYIQTLLLLLGVAIGAVCGAVFGPGASIVKPIGEMFLNMMFMIVVPLVFFCVAYSVCKLTTQKKVWKVLGWSVAVFLVTSVVAGILTWMICEFWNPLGAFATRIPPERSGIAGVALAGRTFLETLENMFTVSDFRDLLSKDKLLPLFVFSAFFGAAVSLCAEKGRTVARFLEGGMSVVMAFMRILMYAAPVCLGCYFADMVGNLGGTIVGSYLNTVLIYLVVCVVIFFVINTIYVAAAGGGKMVKDYWSVITGPSLIAISTCSSATTIPSGIEAAKKIGTEESIAESVIPMGVNLHKDGSVVSGVLKIIFVIAFYGLSGYGCLEIVGLAIVTSLVMGAIPIGGMTSEILICSLLGVDPGFAATLLVISMLVDIPATLLNTTDNIVSAICVDKLCDPSK
ncbi:MAG: dicarboxylate/amino acid:cation symporter [Bacteroidales bacterium]|nr:dicarboxylate/amino acid:cation symporter [Bacteroidales bacterium]